MTKKMFASALLLAAALVFCGCESVEMVDRNNDRGPAVAGIDYRDFNYTAEVMIHQMLETGCLNHPGGGRYVVAIDRVQNETTQPIDVDQLIKKIRVEMLNSGKAVISTAVSGGGPEDSLNALSRELANDPNFRKDSVPKQGTLVAPELSLSGKIIEQSNRITSRKRQIDYYFQMTLTDLSTGVAIWESEHQIIKRQRY